MCENFKTWIVPLSLKTWHSKLEEPLSQEGRKTWQWRLFVQSDNLWIMLLGWKQGGRGLRQASAMLHQSPYVNQLVCAVGGVLDFIAKSEWRGGEQKKWKKWNLTCLFICIILRSNIYSYSLPQCSASTSCALEAREVYDNNNNFNLIINNYF